MSKLGIYFFNVFLGLSQMLNTLLAGDPDESISGRCGRAILTGKPKFWVRPLARFIDGFFKVVFREDLHVIKSVEWDDPPRRELWKWHNGNPKW